MKIGISNDHAAVELKYELIKHLEAKGHQVVNFGTNTSESYDYPLAGQVIGEAVRDKKVDCGIAICGTGIGISLAANKIKGVRAACVSEPVSASLTKAHNDANIICFGARIVGVEVAKAIVDAWLETPFDGGERHKRRVKMIMDLEK